MFTLRCQMWSQFAGGNLIVPDGRGMLPRPGRFLLPVFHLGNKIRRFWVEAPARYLQMTKQRINSARKSFCSALLLCLATAIPSPAQTFSTLLSFNGTGGGGSDGAFAQGLDGDLYASAEGGPQSDDAGTIYKITPSGMLTTLYAFACQGESCPNGADPYAGLVLATDGSFYGTTTGGGAVFHGTVFKITHGDFALLHSFNYKQGRSPYGGLVQGTDGTFMGPRNETGSTLAAPSSRSPPTAS
jgi:uncharacterized repeat protein (TIGR03803 family)